MGDFLFIYLEAALNYIILDSFEEQYLTLSRKKDGQQTLVTNVL